MNYYLHTGLFIHGVEIEDWVLERGGVVGSALRYGEIEISSLVALDRDRFGGSIFFFFEKGGRGLVIRTGGFELPIACLLAF